MTNVPFPLAESLAMPDLGLTPEEAKVFADLEAEIAKRPDYHAVEDGHDNLGGHVFKTTNLPIVLAARPEWQRLMAPVGVRFVSNSRGTAADVYAPDVTRLRRAIAQHGLPIALITAASTTNRNIPANVYAATLRAGFHPVGVARWDNYVHDLCDPDHFPAVRAGGKPLIKWFVDSGLDGVNLAKAYDQGTALITSALGVLFREPARQNIEGVYAELQAVMRLFRSDDDPRNGHWNAALTTAEQERLDELRSILYTGLLTSGIDRPEILGSIRERAHIQEAGGVGRRLGSTALSPEDHE